jgi:hypothetical protein
MRNGNVEQLWYALWLIKGMVWLSFWWAVALLCKWGLRRIRSERAKRHLLKQSIVLGTLKPLRNINASESKVMDRSPSERKERIG